MFRIKGTDHFEQPFAAFKNRQKLAGDVVFQLVQLCFNRLLRSAWCELSGLVSFGWDALAGLAEADPRFAENGLHFAAGFDHRVQVFRLDIEVLDDFFNLFL